MAPGPVTAVTISKGNESPHAGGLVAVGHGVVEFPLMIALFYGFGYLLEFPYVTAAVGFLGGTVLLIMAVGMLRSAGQVEMGSVASFRSPMVCWYISDYRQSFFSGLVGDSWCCLDPTSHQIWNCCLLCICSAPLVV